jgi:hypothetical protein
MVTIEKSSNLINVLLSLLLCVNCTMKMGLMPEKSLFMFQLDGVLTKFDVYIMLLEATSCTLFLTIDSSMADS